jgi:two-component system sensor histidine kinase RegB
MALCLFAVGVSAYIWRIAEEARSVAAALTTTQMALAREQRISSLGALAAATAHELGTPLGTIAIVANELAEDLPEDSPIAGDVALLVGESRRCRDILENLARRPGDPPAGAPDETMEITALLMNIAETYGRAGIRVDLVREPEDPSPVPVMERTPELTHGLANLIHNALRFARHRVVLRVAWSRQQIRVAILDDGPGFAAGLLGKLGEPYLAERGRNTGREPHLGLGIFIAKTLLHRQGAELTFSNVPNFGAQVAIRWPRPISGADV